MHNTQPVAVAVPPVYVGVPWPTPAQADAAAAAAQAVVAPAGKNPTPMHSPRNHIVGMIRSTNYGGSAFIHESNWEELLHLVEILVRSELALGENRLSLPEPLVTFMAECSKCKFPLHKVSGYRAIQNAIRIAPTTIVPLITDADALRELYSNIFTGEYCDNTRLTRKMFNSDLYNAISIALNTQYDETVHAVPRLTNHEIRKAIGIVPYEDITLNVNKAMKAIQLIPELTFETFLNHDINETMLLSIAATSIYVYDLACEAPYNIDIQNLSANEFVVNTELIQIASIAAGYLYATEAMLIKLNAEADEQYVTRALMRLSFVTFLSGIKFTSMQFRYMLVMLVHRFANLTRFDPTEFVDMGSLNYFESMTTVLDLSRDHYDLSVNAMLSIVQQLDSATRQ